MLKNILEKINSPVAIVSGVAGVASFVLAYILANGWTPETPGFTSKDRYSCASQPDTKNGGEVWTVMYRNDKGIRPWLRMVNTFGDDWNTLKRCNSIAERLENFRKDGVIGFSYRSDPKTPKQNVICVNTKLDRNNCNLLITLKPGTEAYHSLRIMTEALRNGTSIEQSSNGSPVASFPPDSNFFSVEDYLAVEDLNAKVNTSQ